MNHRHRMSRVVLGLMSSFPFYGPLALRLKVQPDQGVGDMACNGDALFYNPEWSEDVPADVLRYTVARLATACALKHHTRRGSRDVDKWQTASYYASAPIVHDAGVYDANAEPIPDEFNGLSADRIYDLLPDPDDKDGDKDDGQGDDAGGAGQQGAQAQGDGQQGDGLGEQPGPGKILDWPGPDEPAEASASGGSAEAGDDDDAAMTVQLHEQSWDQAVHQAAQIAKAEGNEAGSMQAMLDKSHSPAQEWAEILKEWFTSLAQTDYTWSRPNRRYVAQGLYLPSLYGTRMGPMVVIADLSGSTRRVWGDFWQCVRDIGADVQPEALHLLGVDRDVTVAETFEPEAMPETFEVDCGGGTDFVPGFEWIDRELDQEPAVVVYLTDGICTSFPEPPPYPVLWCQTGAAERHVPFGK